MSLASLITPENLAGVLTAVAAVLSAVGGIVLWKGRKEPAPAGTIDATREALAENTAALREMGAQFMDNNKLFSDVLMIVRDMAKDAEATREHLNAIREHLNAIRDNFSRR